MNNKIEALLHISNKANEYFKWLLYYEPQEKLMFARLRDVLLMTSELTERIERISDDFINKETLLKCLSNELQSYIYDMDANDLDRMIFITRYAEKLSFAIDELLERVIDSISYDSNHGFKIFLCKEKDDEVEE